MSRAPIRFKTGRADIHSTVREFEPASRVVGTTDHWLAYHTWLLMPRPDGSIYVVMEETGDGADPRSSPRPTEATCTAATTRGISA